VTPFAKNLAYPTGYERTLKIGQKEILEIQVQAVLEDGTKIGNINIKKEGERRIFIQDIDVANDYRKKGIATMLVYNMEEKFPPGTELYFIDNLAPEFWQQMGFKPVNKDEKTEYCKTL
jgi:N-acetylglutamate synthase-like GNAT family acetyltransferase